MKLRCLSLSAMLLMAVPVWAAETRAPVAAPRASAPTAVKPGPRLMSPAEMNANASPPGDLRPENPVTPQIVIPLRGDQPTAPTKPEKRNAKGVRPASTGGVNDAAARCEALSDAAARAACREGIKR